ncbi:LOW QUALITY PROTEIN: hypothetical protein U9M48_036782 [Paspalum notatum var. saurae]|uniref:DDE Tnp4 domain-containing protein n=1 Tax=Paspalum notatum var. saurae TaxID=547442 RepID=A0AAQ3UF42_PASNO
MDKRTKLLVFSIAAYILLSMMAMIIATRKRARIQGITYGPIDERDRMRLEYLENKIWKDDTTCVNMLRLSRAKFFRFCNLFRDRGLLEDTIHMSVEQQVAMFLNTVGHNLRNRLVGTNFDRSGETVNRHFNKVLRAIGELRGDLIKPPSLETPSKIAGNHRWDPYFKDCIGAIDGTHERASVPRDIEHAFRGRKSYATQNVMAAVDFDLRFTYVLAGWEGTAHDALVLQDALERENDLRVPQGKFYLVDAQYGAKPGFLPPFRGVRYHLNECGNNPVQNEEELFNLRHSSLRVTVERAFGALKRIFKILDDDATPFFPFKTQVDIVVACCIIHNWVIQDGSQANEHAVMVDFRQGIADQMWADYQNNNSHKPDAEYLNKPLQHFSEMQIIFGNSMATENFAKDSSVPLGTEDGETEIEEGTGHGLNDGINTPPIDMATPSASRPKKKAKTENEDERLISAFKSVGNDLTDAIKTAGKPDNDLPSDLFDQLKNLPGFEKAHVSFYFSYLVANPHIARGFYALPFEHKIDMFAIFGSERFPGQ